MSSGLHLVVTSHHALIGPVALVVSAAFPWLLAIGTRLFGQRVTARLAWVPVGSAVLAGIEIARSGPSAVGVAVTGGQFVAGLWVDSYSVTLVVLVTLVGALVQVFSLRHLQSDARAARFAARAHVLVGAMVVVAGSATLAGLVVGWVAAGMAFTSLLGYRPDLAGVEQSVATTRKVFVAGDAAIVVAACWMIARAGNVEVGPAQGLRSAAAHMGNAGPIVAMLVVIAALARSAQFPLGRWMTGTVNAPTPVSALLHAGVVNGGGILLVRMDPLITSSLAATLLVLGCATVTLLLCTMAIRARADVKGSLVMSTRAQMGFMLVECAVGLPVFATIHLVGHALYKATLFLGSGGGIRRPGRRPIRPERSQRALSGISPVLAGTAAAAVVLAVMLTMPGHPAGGRSWPLLVFAGATAGALGRAWWHARPRGWGWPVVAAIGLAGAGAAYTALLLGLEGWLSATVHTGAATPIGPWYLVVLGGLLVLLVLVVGNWSPAASIPALLVPTGVVAGRSRGPSRTWLRRMPGIVSGATIGWDRAAG